jgi:hypothetical protein
MVYYTYTMIMNNSIVGLSKEGCHKTSFTAGLNTYVRMKYTAPLPVQEFLNNLWG